MLRLLIILLTIAATLAQGLIINPWFTSSSSNPCDSTFNVTTLTNDLTCYWKMDEVSGNRADSWVNAQTLTDNNTVTSNPGIITNAAQFTVANSEYLSHADNSTLSYSGSFSVNAWAYLNATNATFTIASKAAGAGAREWAMDFRNLENCFRFFVYAGGTTPTVALATNFLGINLNTWYMVTGTYNSTNEAITLYVNTNGVPSMTLGGTPSDTVSEFQVGAFNAGSFFGGRIDELGFWKRVLNTNEIAALYKCGAARTCCDPGFSP